MKIFLALLMFNAWLIGFGICAAGSNPVGWVFMGFFILVANYVMVPMTALMLGE